MLVDWLPGQAEVAFALADHLQTAASEARWASAQQATEDTLQESSRVGALLALVALAWVGGRALRG